MDNRIEIKDDRKENMIKEIKRYFFQERDEDLGDLAATMVLDFFIKELAPQIYNQGIEDAYSYITDKIEDLHAIKILKR
ncbi:DUF2164 domain-containing protein [Dethiothermospora halolimnae]|uniref:DUF2164 domain-containing protein n=1 Tax=Dethiothermospora halolimnae TaxID=3114390 RepID=UPI003CCBA94D